LTGVSPKNRYVLCAELSLQGGGCLIRIKYFVRINLPEPMPTFAYPWAEIFTVPWIRDNQD
jgi:hypothetical protein